MKTRGLTSKLLTRREAAEYLGLKPQTLAAWAVTGHYGLSMIRVGRSARYRIGSGSLAHGADCGCGGRPARRGRPVTVDTSEVETIGQFQMALEFAEPSPEPAARWSRRAETLAALLLSEWQRELAENTGIAPITSRSDEEANAPLFAGGKA